MPCIVFVQKECGKWVEASRILLSDVKGSPVDLQLSGKTVPQPVSDISICSLVEYRYASTECE